MWRTIQIGRRKCQQKRFDNYFCCQVQIVLDSVSARMLQCAHFELCGLKLKEAITICQSLH